MRQTDDKSVYFCLSIIYTKKSKIILKTKADDRSIFAKIIDFCLILFADVARMLPEK